jgi:putative DNA primase/helicase
MNAERLLKRLRGVRRNGGGWRALCPAHADKKPSLSIDIRDDKLFVHCHAGCAQEAVLAALKMEASKLFLDTNKVDQRIVAEYQYEDENGGQLFQVVRFDPKDFRQRRPNGQDGWIWNLNGVRRVPYRLPEVLAAPDVVIVEGEKDVETARSLGLVATCSPGGAGKWRKEYSESLRGKNVIIIADADEPGRKHAQQVSESLHLRAKSVRMLELPGRKDLSEWNEHGGTREGLLELIRGTPEWKPAAGLKRGGFTLTKLGDLLNEPEEKVSWLIPNKLPLGGISVLAAKPKVGKSTLARCLALAIARGEIFLGCQTTRGPVIYLALEEKRSEVRRHFADLGATGEESIHIHCAAAPQDAMIELCRLTAEIRPVLIIIDPLFKFVRIRDEKAYAEVCQAIEPLLTLAREMHVHVMLVHHCGKAERADAMDAILGSTAIFGGVDSALVLKRSDRYRTLKSEQKYGVDWPETILEFDTETRWVSLGAEKSEAEATRIAEAIISYLGGTEEPRTRVEIEAHVEGRTTHKRAALKSLCATGEVSESGAGSKGDPLRYRLVGAEAKKSSDSCSHINTGTREQESQNEARTRINTGDILVPEVSGNLEDISTPREQEFLEGEL